MQQKMMKYMMVFMAFMFYKVPSGPRALLHHEQPLVDRRAAAAAEAHALEEGRGGRRGRHERPGRDPAARPQAGRRRQRLALQEAPVAAGAGRERADHPQCRRGRRERERPDPRAARAEPQPTASRQAALRPNPDRTSVLDPSDTIVAISSHPGPAARGIVRLSGPEALAIALDGFEGDADGSVPLRPAVHGGCIRLTDPAATLPATLVLWPGPRSYTGQPVAEIHTVGSPPLLEHLVARVPRARGTARRARRVHPPRSSWPDGSTWPSPRPSSA